MTTGKSIALTIWTFVGKMMPLLFNMLSRFVTAGWIVCTAIMMVYYHRFQMDKSQLVLEEVSEK